MDRKLCAYPYRTYSIKANLLHQTNVVKMSDFGQAELERVVERDGQHRVGR